MDNLILIALLVVALAAVVCAAIFKTKNSGLQQELLRLQQSSEGQNQELVRLQQDNMSLTSQNAALSADKAHFDTSLAERDQAIKALHEQLAAKETQVRAQCQEENQKTLAEVKSAHQDAVAKLETSLATQVKELEALRTQLQSATNDLTQAKSEKEAVQKLREADQERYNKASQELELRLNNLGERLLKERSESLQKLNSEQMGTIIKPLASELETFRNLLTATQKTNSEQAGQLQNELKHLHAAQQSLGLQADKLAAALLQGNKSQGIWGEQQLELVLESAGLVRDVTYLREVAVKDDEQGKRGRVDALVKLPGHRGIVIDAKCSLAAYTEYVNLEQLALSVGLDANALLFNLEAKADAAPALAAQDSTSTPSAELTDAESSPKLTELKSSITTITPSDLRARLSDALKRHIESVEHHVGELVDRNYPQYEQYGSPDLVFMFVPIDHALGLALRAKPDLYTMAQEKGIFLVSPSSLLPALRLVGNLWSLAEQGEKFKQLSKLAERIAIKGDKVCRDFQAVTRALETLTNATKNLSTSLYDGRGNLNGLLGNFASNAPALTAQALAQIELDFEHERTAALVKNDLDAETSTEDLSDTPALTKPEEKESKPRRKRATAAPRANADNAPTDDSEDGIA